MAIRRTLLNALMAVASKESIAGLQELKLSCSDGTILAAQRWTAAGNSPITPKNTIICLHGWLDNCRSFYHLAPALAASGTHQVVALDLPGHGWSSHKSKDAPPMVQAEMIYYVSEAIHGLDQVENITLIGHSLGAGIASLYTAAFPEQIQQLILLDGAGFLAREAKDTALHVRNHITRRRMKQQESKPPRIYPSLELAIKTRVQSATRMPGRQSISYEAAEELVQRATRPCEDGFQFRHDPRFTWPSIQYMTWEQNEGVFESVGPTDCCLLLADDGWPFDPYQMERTKNLLDPVVFHSLPGSHFFHADPLTADAVTDAVLEFLSRDKVVTK
jgi:pimeloyl-ACP methyl ester carboxylesterase